MVNIVNSEDGPDEVIIKYLTKGHTHMSADGIHGNIESKIRRKGKVFYFQDLINTIEGSRNGRNKLTVLQLVKFCGWKNKKRTTKKKDDPFINFKMTNIVQAQFVKKSFNLGYKYNFEDDVSEINFLQKSALREVGRRPLSDNTQRGIPMKKKKEIVKILVPLMPQNRQSFWNELPVSESSLDLVHNEEYDISISSLI